MLYTQFLPLLITATTAVLINLLLTPIILFVARKHDLYDTVDDRKIHTEATPRLGGIGIFLSTVLAAGLTMLVIQHKPEMLTAYFLDPQSYLVLGSLAGIFFLGLLDDFVTIRARLKLAGQILMAVLAVAGGIQLESFTIPFLWYELPLGVMGIPVTLLWIIAITNAVNLIDGMDGLAGGISAIGAAALGIAGVVTGDLVLSFLCFSLMGALLGFLFFNFPPAKLFMGDGGSLFLGFFLAVVPLAGPKMPPTTQAVFIPITVLIIPVLDMIGAMIRRRRKGLHFFTPDREHIHHKLLSFGLDTRQILAIIYGFSIVFSVGSVLWLRSPRSNSFFLILGAWLTGLILFIYLDHRHHHDN